MKKNAVGRILEVLRHEKKEISAIYFYAVFNGLVQLSLPLGIQSIIGFVIGGTISTSLIVLIVLVVSGVLINGLLQVNQMKIIEKIQQQLYVRYAFQYAYLIPQLNLRGIDRYYLPEQVNRFLDTAILQKGLSKLLLDIPAASLQILFGLIILSFYHPIFIFFGLVLIAILYGLLTVTGNRGLESSIEESNAKYGLVSWLEEVARTVTSFKFSQSSNLHIMRTDMHVSGYLDARTRHFKILMIQYWSLIIFKVIITAAMLIVGSILLVNQQLNIGQFVAAEIIIITVINSVEKIIKNLDKVYDVLTSVEKITTITEKPLEEGGRYLPEAARDKGYEVQAMDLTFAYDEKVILDRLSFHAMPGQTVCVQGEWGAGKSTLLKVLTGSYQPYSGNILIDGISLANYDLSAYRSRMGIVLGDLDLFEGTLMENITMGREEISVQEVMTLAESVGLKNFLDNAPGSLQMPVNSAGKRLSKKVIHKILLVRALAGKPRLLLMEEPWLVLEKEHAEKVKQLLLDQFKNVTKIIVTNDTSFAEKCDMVIDLSDNKPS